VVNTNAKPQVQNNEFIDGLMGVLTSVKIFKLTIQRIAVRFYRVIPSVGFLGSSRPSLGFTLGAKMMFDMKLQKMVGLLIIKSSIKILLRLPIRCLRQPQMWICSGFKIDLTADRSYSKNFRTI
jgi:hypothetical protein